MFSGETIPYACINFFQGRIMKKKGKCFQSSLTGNNGWLKSNTTQNERTPLLIVKEEQQNYKEQLLDILRKQDVCPVMTLSLSFVHLLENIRDTQNRL
jgi:hypothetical protein